MTSARLEIHEVSPVGTKDLLWKGFLEQVSFE